MPVFQPVIQQNTSGGTYQKEVEVDFGPIPLYDFTFIITDISISTSSIVSASMSGSTPTGKDPDEVMMDSYLILASPGNGFLSIYIRGLEGYLHDKFKITYLVGN